MRALKVSLWIAGILCLLAGLGVFVPLSALEHLANLFGDKPFPKSGLFAYTLRGLLATYLGIGAFYVLLALNPMKYGLMVPLAGAAPILVGLCCAFVGAVMELPKAWYMGDLGMCSALGLLILIFWSQVARAQQRAAVSETEEGQ